MSLDAALRNTEGPRIGRVLVLQIDGEVRFETEERPDGTVTFGVIRIGRPITRKEAKRIRRRMPGMQYATVEQVLCELLGIAPGERVDYEM